jgi:hypothetical protein
MATKTVEPAPFNCIALAGGLRSMLGYLARSNETKASFRNAHFTTGHGIIFGGPKGMPLAIHKVSRNRMRSGWRVRKSLRSRTVKPRHGAESNPDSVCNYKVDPSFQREFCIRIEFYKTTVLAAKGAYAQALAMWRLNAGPKGFLGLSFVPLSDKNDIAIVRDKPLDHFAIAFGTLHLFVGDGNESRLRPGFISARIWDQRRT